MEPQLEGCGKAKPLGALIPPCHASMEPQLEGCGKMHPVPPPLDGVSASMEPQLEGCGKNLLGVRQISLGVLQWSRNLRVAESASARARLALSASLQWSRNLRVAESSVYGAALARQAASMEPQLEGCGKSTAAPKSRSVLCFNGAAT